MLSAQGAKAPPLTYVPLDPAGGSAVPETPVIGSRSALAMWPPKLKFWMMDPPVVTSDWKKQRKVQHVTNEKVNRS